MSAPVTASVVSSVDDDTVVQRNPDQITVRIDDQVVAMSLSQGKYIGFDPIASVVWDRLETPMRADALWRALAEDYEGDPATIRADVLELLSALVDLDLLAIAPSAS